MYSIIVYHTKEGKSSGRKELLKEQKRTERTIIRTGGECHHFIFVLYHKFIITIGVEFHLLCQGSEYQRFVQSLTFV